MKRLMTIFLMCVLLVACTHKDLCYDHPHTTNLNVQFDWSSTPTKVPASMSVYFFKEGSQPSLRYEFTNPEGGRIRMTPGVFHAVCVNSDERSHMVQNTDDYDNFYVTTKDASYMTGLATFGISFKDIPKAKNAQQERIVAEPSNVWYSNARDIVLEERTEHHLPLYVQPKIVTYNIEITNASNLKWVYGVSATISGMAGGMYPATGELSDEKVTIPFEARMNKEENKVTGSFTSFGHCPGEDGPHYLKVYAVLADNSWWDFTYDVSELMHDAQEGDVITIRLDELPIPKPVANGGGFKPTVGEWNSVEIELKM